MRFVVPRPGSGLSIAPSLLRVLVTTILPVTDDRLYFRQLLAGRDFAVDDQIARQMVNFVYLVGDRRPVRR